MSTLQEEGGRVFLVSTFYTAAQKNKKRLSTESLRITSQIFSLSFEMNATYISKMLYADS